MFHKCNYGTLNLLFALPIPFFFLYFVVLPHLRGSLNLSKVIPFCRKSVSYVCEDEKMGIRMVAKQEKSAEKPLKKGRKKSPGRSEVTEEPTEGFYPKIKQLVR